VHLLDIVHRALELVRSAPVVDADEERPQGRGRGGMGGELEEEGPAGGGPELRLLRRSACC
jgi:hypothetical protein